LDKTLEQKMTKATMTNAAIARLAELTGIELTKQSLHSIKNGEVKFTIYPVEYERAIAALRDLSGPDSSEENSCTKTYVWKLPIDTITVGFEYGDYIISIRCEF
jgi:hypothetical protein